MKKIAFDVMGNDNGVKAAVQASLNFTNANNDFIIYLIGDKNEINKYATENNKIKIIDAPQLMSSSASEARTARNGNSSMATAINMVKNGEADVVISSGNSATYLSMSTLSLRRINGVKRPAFMPIFPTIKKGKRFAFLDAGANLESSPEMLEQWAVLGSVFVTNVLNVKSPRVSLLNIGTEDDKGKEFHIEANKILKNNNKINYHGFIEPRTILNHTTDVAVVDGYAGNMILKSMEGTTLSLLTLIKKEILKKLKYKIGYLFSKGAFKNIKKTLDYRNVGSAWLIGLNGLAIKCHGGADSQSYMGAFGQIQESLNIDLLTKFKEAFNE